MPVAVAESPGVMMAALLELRAPVIDPFPNSEPPFRLTAPGADSDPSSVVAPTDCVNIPEPPNLNVLPVLMVKVPVLLKLPTVVKVALLAKVSLLVLVARF